MAPWCWRRCTARGRFRLERRTRSSLPSRSTIDRRRECRVSSDDEWGSRARKINKKTVPSFVSCFFLVWVSLRRRRRLIRARGERVTHAEERSLARETSRHLAHALPSCPGSTKPFLRCTIPPAHAPVSIDATTHRPKNLRCLLHRRPKARDFCITTHCHSRRSLTLSISPSSYPRVLTP